MKRFKTLITCEHASKKIPAICLPYLEPEIDSFDTHQIYDWGASAIAQELSHALRAPLVQGEWTRLAIELNRSVGNPELFSAPIRSTSEVVKARLVADIYLPFREKVESRIQRWIKQGHTVIHFSIHSFTPIFDGVKRDVTLGVLFDPSRSFEVSISQILIETFRRRHPNWSVQANQPYTGIADGHTTALRKQFTRHYAGIELEYSQGLDLIEKAASFAEDVVKSCQTLDSHSEL